MIEYFENFRAKLYNYPKIKEKLIGKGPKTRIGQ
jgi:hypothetical protein